MRAMLETWRWFGDADPVTLDDVRQTGASGVVSALHHKYDGGRWELSEIIEHREKISRAGLHWEVCESIPIPTAIKLGEAGRDRAIGIWKDNLADLGRAGIKTVCYNWMPYVDWMRTDLAWRLANNALALRFDYADFVAYDVFVLKRKYAECDYAATILEAAAGRAPTLQGDRLRSLERAILGGLPASETKYTRVTLKAALERNRDFSAADLRENLLLFLNEVTPIAESFGMRLAIHPDDPPIPLFGLPRIVSTAADARALLAANASPANGLTLCCGSYGACPDNDLASMAKEFSPRIYFAHLRNVRREPDGSFYEADHLDGDTDLIKVIAELLREEARRRAAGAPFAQIPMRPDHGHLLLDDQRKQDFNPGYSCIGRLRGLAELRGVIRALEWSMDSTGSAAP
jgi:mannonate dehydratase